MSHVLGTREYVQVVAWHLTRLVIQFHGPFVSALVRAVLLSHNFFTETINKTADFANRKIYVKVGGKGNTWGTFLTRLQYSITYITIKI